MFFDKNSKNLKRLPPLRLIYNSYVLTSSASVWLAVHTWIQKKNKQAKPVKDSDHDFDYIAVMPSSKQASK